VLGIQPVSMLDLSMFDRDADYLYSFFLLTIGPFQSHVFILVWNPQSTLSLASDTLLTHRSAFDCDAGLPSIRSNFVFVDNFGMTGCTEIV